MGWRHRSIISNLRVNTLLTHKPQGLKGSSLVGQPRGGLEVKELGNCPLRDTVFTPRGLQRMGWNHCGGEKLPTWGTNCDCCCSKSPLVKLSGKRPHIFLCHVLKPCRFCARSCQGFTKRRMSLCSWAALREHLEYRAVRCAAPHRGSAARLAHLNLIFPYFAILPDFFVQQILMFFLHQRTPGGLNFISFFDFQISFRCVFTQYFCFNILFLV